MYHHILPYGYDSYSMSRAKPDTHVEKQILKRWGKKGQYQKLKKLVSEIFDDHHNEEDL